MKIKFKKEYSDDVVWSRVVLDFLKYLSKKYGYTIDSYNVAALPEHEIVEKLGDLYNENSESLTYHDEYVLALSRLASAKAFQKARREKVQKVSKAMMEVAEREEVE